MTGEHRRDACSAKRNAPLLVKPRSIVLWEARVQEEGDARSEHSNKNHANRCSYTDRRADHFAVPAATHRPRRNVSAAAARGGESGCGALTVQRSPTPTAKKSQGRENVRLRFKIGGSRGEARTPDPTIMSRAL